MAHLNNSAQVLIGERINLLSDFLVSLQMPDVILLITVKAWLYAQENMPAFIEKGDDYATDKMLAFIDELWTKADIPTEVRRSSEIPIN